MLLITFSASKPAPRLPISVASLFSQIEALCAAPTQMGGQVWIKAQGGKVVLLWGVAFCHLRHLIKSFGFRPDLGFDIHILRISEIYRDFLQERTRDHEPPMTVENLDL
jgi:hypothetical protein